MKWLVAAKGLFVLIISALMTDAKTSESIENYDGAISVFNAVRVLHYSATLPLTVSKVYVKRGEKVKEGDPIISFDHQGNERTIRAPRPVTIDNMYVSAGQRMETDGHLFDASIFSSGQGQEGQPEDEEPKTAGLPIQDYLLFK